jgi:AraC-like DNA-binding protein
MPSFNLEDVDTLLQFSAKDGLPYDSTSLLNDQLLLHEEFEIFFVKAGDVTWFINDEMFPAEPNSLVVFNNQEVHKPHIRSNKRFERLKLLFKPEFASQFSSAGNDLLACFTDRPLGRENIRKLSRSQCAEFLGLFERLETASQEAAPDSRLVKLLAFLEILLFTNRVFRETEKAEELPLLPEPVLRAMDYIERHLDGDLSLETIGRECRVSVYYLCRAFKSQTGSTIHNYILYKRVSEAKGLLRDGVKVSQVGALCGFGSVARFAEAFKKIVGQSPSAFARNEASRGAPLPGEAEEPSPPLA